MNEITDLCPAEQFALTFALAVCDSGLPGYGLMFRSDGIALTVRCGDVESDGRWLEETYDPTTGGVTVRWSYPFDPR